MQGVRESGKRVSKLLPKPCVVNRNTKNTIAITLIVFLLLLVLVGEHGPHIQKSSSVICGAATLNFLKTRAVCLECNINRVDHGHDFNRHREIATMYPLCVSVIVRHCARFVQNSVFVEFKRSMKP